MNSSASNVVCMIVLLSASAVSSSFSPSACLGRKSFGAIAPGAAESTALTPRVTSPVATTLAMSGGDLEGATSISINKLGPDATPPGLLRRLFSSFPWHVLPNYLTYARCLAIPLFMILSYYPVRFPNRALVLSIVFALASFTDWLDGFLARRWDITSPFGAFLDPVADKLMVSTALIILAGRYGGIVAIPTSIIMAREVSVSALREWMAQQGKRDTVKVGMQGKIKTALTMITITLMLLVPEGIGVESVAWSKYSANAGWSKILGCSLLMLFASTLITVTSGSVYFRAALPVLLGKE